jgi:hypothetical protein
MTLSSPTVSLQTSQHASTTITLTSLGNFADNIGIVCGNLPAYVTCTFTPASAALSGNATATVSLDLDTDSVLARTVDGPIKSSPASAALALLFPPFGLLALLATRRNANRRTFFFLAAILTLPAALLLTACGPNVITPIASAAPGTYAVPITATGASTGASHSATLTLIITP